MITTNVTVNLSDLKKFGKEIHSGDRLVVVYKKWAMRYRSFIQLRFDAASKGDGTWVPLSSRTIAGRRKGSSTILRDTGVLFAALSPVWVAPPGSINELLQDGVRIGFGGSQTHPSGFATIAEIAGFHQDGAGNLPKREIIVNPSQSVIDSCTQDLQKELAKSTS
jgi:hypothetical protein